MEKKVKLPDDKRFDETFAVIRGDSAKIYGQNFGNRGRDMLYLLRETTAEEAMRLAAEAEAARQKATAEAAAAKAAAQTREEKLASLVGIYGDLSLNKRGEVEDRWGNYLFSLPDPIPEDVGKWIKQRAKQVWPE